MAAVGLAAQQMKLTLPTDMTVGLTYTQYISPGCAVGGRV
ncbi:hypothetical protein EMIT0P258_90023 [Pseudomonas sp. IT-P258]